MASVSLHKACLLLHPDDDVSSSVPHTAAGASAVRRFQRPVCFQDLPGQALSEALGEDDPLHLPRRVDGALVPAPVMRSSTGDG